MKPIEDYKTTLRYPERPLKPCLLADAKPDQIRQYANEVEKWHTDMKQYGRAVKEWEAHQDKVTADFRRDALESLGLTNHPKADKIYAYAWDKGHSGGFHEVYSTLQDIADLFT